MKKTFIIIFLCFGFLVAKSQSNTINTFAPDPLTVLDQSYTDQDGSADNFFTSAYSTATINYSSISGTGIVGSRVNIVALENPTITNLDVPTANGDFKVPRSDPRFKAYNAYYHADKFIEFLEGHDIDYLPMVNIDPYTDFGVDGGGVEMDGSDVTGVTFVKHYNEADPNAESVDMAEDAFGIANVIAEVYMIYNLKHDDLDQGVAGIISMDMPDIKIGLKDYLSQSYVHALGATDHLCYNWGGQPSIKNQGNQRATDFSLLPSGREFNSQIFIDEVSSQWLSSTLMSVQGGTTKVKCDTWIINSLAPVNLNSIDFDADDPQFKIDDMYQYIWYLYDQALGMVGNGAGQFSLDDMCVIYNELSLTYGESFWSYRDGPPNEDGEIYIKDNAAHTGTEVTTGSYTNSPSIWNRHDENDFTPEHQNPYGGGAPTTTQYINIAIDGSFCDIQGLINIVGDVHYKIYRSVPKLGYEWPLDWDDENVHNAPEGDLIGTFYVKDPDNGNLSTYRDDQGQIVTGWNFSNEGNLLILSFPWEVPDYLYDIWLPNISPKDNSGLGFSFQDAFLVRVESSQYDPIANGEVANVYANVQNNNNIAMKTSNITIVYEQGSTGSTPGFLLPNDDDDPGDVVISVNPSTHDPVRPVHPDPTDPDGPFVPIHPEFNNYMDYGEVRIVLDEDTHQDWIANGTQGNGFIVNGDNEIVVTRSDFTLEGIPRSVRGGQIRAMGVRYYAANGTFTSRTGFDVVAKNSAGNIIGSTHFEVREDSGSSVPRSSAGDNVNGDITIYPNPINGNTLHLDNITREGSYTIMGVDGKTHAQGRYSKAQKSLDISILNKGIYFIRFANDEGVTETKQLIINN